MAIKNIPDLVAAAALAGTDLMPVTQGSDVPVKAALSDILTYVKSGVYHKTNIIGTVSQTGGVPTGAIVERGSNANGEYVKYADGTMICTQPSFGTTTCDTVAGSVFSSGDLAWTFPVSFTSSSIVLGGSGGSTARWPAFSTPSSSAITFRMYSYVSSTFAGAVRVFAIGRWF